MTPRTRLRCAVTAALAAGLLAALPSAAQAAPSAPAGGQAAARSHKVVHPTLERAVAQPAASRSTLRYGGGVAGVGVTIGAPKVYLVFWGSQWGTKTTNADGTISLSGDTAGAAPQLQRLFQGLGTNSERYSNVMAQYCDGAARGATTCAAGLPKIGYPTGGALAGVLYDNASAMPANATDNQIAKEAIRAAGLFGNTTAASQRSVQYVVLSPPGTHPGGFNTPSAGWCAWHDWNGDTTLVGGAASSPYGNLAFTNMPYVLDLGTSCGRNYVNAGSGGTLDGFSIVEGHEYAETITDQFPAGGWVASTGAENADLCAWKGVGGLGGAGNIALATGSFAMQGTWSNLDNGCRLVR